MKIKQILNVPFQQIFIHYNIQSMTRITLIGEMNEGRSFGQQGLFYLRQNHFSRDIDSIIIVVDLQFETK